MASCCLFSFQGCKGYLCTLQVYILSVLRRTIWLLKHYVWTKSNTLIQSCLSTDLALTDMEPVYLHTACSHSITRRKNTACNPLTGPWSLILLCTHMIYTWCWSRTPSHTGTQPLSSACSSGLKKRTRKAFGMRKKEKDNDSTWVAHVRPDSSPMQRPDWCRGGCM